MSRLDYATIVIVAVCLIAAGFLLYKTYNMFTDGEETPIEEENPPSYDDDDTYYYDTTQVDTTGYNDGSEVPNYEDNAATNNNNFDNTPNSYDSDPQGSYMVLAGTFSNAANAERFIQDLRDKGFNNARIEPFDGGAYDVILVDRFSTYSEASDLVQQLKNQNIEAYVQRKRGATAVVKE